ncbi:MAG: hypothetical protein U9O50_09370 [Acidobacteriota bacterium]|nr:hypothetical protein [Acidobacteriota bacterium]
MILLDSDVIIDLHRLNVWNNVVAKNKIYISSIILRQEVHFFKDCNGIRHYIDLLKNAGSLFQETSISAEDLKIFSQQFDRVFEGELHSGEKEALKILQDNNDFLFCTCDKAAIKAIALLGKKEQGISFEKLLKSSGLTKKIEHKHTEKYFRKYLDEGSIMRIQSNGIKR